MTKNECRDLILEIIREKRVQRSSYAPQGVSLRRFWQALEERYFDRNLLCKVLLDLWRDETVIAVCRGSSCPLDGEWSYYDARVRADDIADVFLYGMGEFSLQRGDLNIHGRSILLYVQADGLPENKAQPLRRSIDGTLT